MTRTATAHRDATSAQSFFQGERALVQRLADDRALDAERRPASASAAQVGQRGHAAGGHHRRGRCAAQTSRSRSRFGPRSVPSLVHVGDDVAGAALGVQPGQRLAEVAAVARSSRGRPACVPRTSRPTAIRSPCRAITDAHPVRVLQRRGADVDPGAAGGRARAASDSSSRMPPDSSTLTSSRADDLGEQRPRSTRGRTPRRGRPGGSTRRRPAARPARPPAGRRTWSPLPASPWTRRTACPSATSTAGSSVSPVTS